MLLTFLFFLVESFIKSHAESYVEVMCTLRNVIKTARYFGVGTMYAAKRHGSTWYMMALDRIITKVGQIRCYRRISMMHIMLNLYKRKYILLLIDNQIMLISIDAEYINSAPYVIPYYGSLHICSWLPIADGVMHRSC